jgi:putative Mg2+ transporter-C (MgtC) family protein
MLACVAAAIAMILSAGLGQVDNAVPGGWRPDPARLAAGVLTGMGFLGAGAIIREGAVVRGVTTAAVLWFVTIIGLAFGAGYYNLGYAGLAIAILCLFVLPWFENFISNDWYSVVTVTVSLDGPSDREIRERVEAAGVKVKRVAVNYSLEKSRRVLRCDIKYKRGDLFSKAEKVVQALVGQRGVIEVDWDY